MKPVCIEVSQLALQHPVQQLPGKHVVRSVKHLLDILNDIASQPFVLDHKLADYVFFPLHYLFRQSKALPSQAIELALRCLNTIILSDWCQKGGSDLTKQLLILLSFLARGDPANTQGHNSSCEVRQAALQCLSSLLDQSVSSPYVSAKNMGDDNVPIFGQVVTVALENLENTLPNYVRLRAIGTLRSLVFAIQDISILRRFMPGMVSKITKVLSHGASSSTPYRVIVGSLQALSCLLQKAMIPTAPPPDGNEEGNDSISQENIWLKASAAQIKLALANIVHLQYHQKNEVVEALFDLGRIVLQDSREMISNVGLLTLETLLTICSRKELVRVTEHNSSLLDILLGDSRLVDALKAKTHDWMLALPRVIQSNDTVNHSRLLNQISTAYQIISRLGADMDLIDMEIGLCLQESVKAAIQAQQALKIQSLTSADIAFSEIIQSRHGPAASYSFDPISLVGNSHKEAIEYISSLVGGLEFLRKSSALRQGLVESLRSQSGYGQLASLWLCLQLLSGHFTSSYEIDQFLNYPEKFDVIDDGFSETIQSYCLCILTNPSIDQNADWRIQGIAIEMIAVRASQEGQEFCAELVDVLYPIVERLGSNNSLLREHTITALNVISRACGYNCSSDLIIQNVDYLLNSIALKFNTFDIRPQTPVVLQMIIQLSGPMLIPYLDDLIDCIFSTLASFHGYQQLVESLFAVLSAVVSEGQKANAQVIDASKEAHHRNRREVSFDITDLPGFLKRQSQRETLMEETESWTTSNDSKTTDNSSENRGTGDGNLEKMRASTVTNALKESNQPPTKSYTTIQSILRIGQHYFTSESPTIRCRLLQLTRIGCDALSQNENEFLPLINDIWPVVMKRLYDPESYVSIEACKTLSEIFRCSGDFVSSRVDNEWPEIRSLYRRIQAKMLSERGGKSGRGRFTSSYQMWEGLVDLCCNMIEHVNIDASIEDDMMDMLSLYMNTMSKVRDALEQMNPDAAWLALEIQRQRKPDAAQLTLPLLQGFSFTELVF